MSLLHLLSSIFQLTIVCSHWVAKKAQDSCLFHCSLFLSLWGFSMYLLRGGFVEGWQYSVMLLVVVHINSIALKYNVNAGMYERCSLTKNTLCKLIVVINVLSKAYQVYSWFQLVQPKSVDRKHFCLFFVVQLSKITHFSIHCSVKNLE